MRTTLTLDEDVVLMLQRCRRQSEGGFKAVVNEALRLGLRQMEQKKSYPTRSFTRPIDAGFCRFPLVSTSEALAVAEGEDYR